MKVGFIYAGSWEHAYPQFRQDFDENVWCRSDDFIMKYPRAVLSHGADPVLLYLSQSASSVADFQHVYGFRLRRVPVRWGAGDHDRELSFRILKEIDREHFDLLHVYNYYRHRWRPDMYDLLAQFCHRRRLPFVVHYQGGEFPRASPHSRLKQWMMEPRRRLKKMTMEWAARVFSVSRLEIERLTNPGQPDYYGLPFRRERFLYVPNILDPSPFQPGPRDKARAALGLDSARRYLLYVGFFREGKGVQHLLRILPRLLRSHPDAHLLLVGSGDYEASLRRLTSDLNLDANVTFTGPIPHAALPPYYRAADLLVLPSYAEGLPSVLLEALACNLPCVATAVGDIPGLLDQGVGLMVAPRNEDHLEAAVDRILRKDFVINPSQRLLKLGEHSYERVGDLIGSEYLNILSQR